VVTEEKYEYVYKIKTKNYNKQLADNVIDVSGNVVVN
jgi:hypothetical protein